MEQIQYLYWRIRNNFIENWIVASCFSVFQLLNHAMKFFLTKRCVHFWQLCSWVINVWTLYIPIPCLSVQIWKMIKPIFPFYFKVNFCVEFIWGVFPLFPKTFWVVQGLLDFRQFTLPELRSLGFTFPFVFPQFFMILRFKKIFLWLLMFFPP